MLPRPALIAQPCYAYKCHRHNGVIDLPLAESVFE
jgi:hypothetical protein